MLNFGSTGAGAGAAQLWKFIGASPDNIELNTGAGVTGVDAKNPLDNLQRFIIGKIIALYEAIGSYWELGTISVFAGVAKRLGQTYAVLLRTNTASNQNAFVTVTPAYIADIGATDNNSESKITVSVTSNDNTIKDVASNDSVEENRNYQQHTTRILQAGSPVINEVLHGTGWYVKDFGAGTLFAIRANGEIWSQQVTAGAHVVPSGFELPIYDQNGILKGYIPINI